MPLGARSTSVQPVKRFSRFHVDSPWRRSTSRTGIFGIALNYNVALRGVRPQQPSPVRCRDRFGRDAALAARAPHDGRSRGESGAGHGLGAKNLPIARLQAQGVELPKRKERPIIVYCDSGDRAGKAAASLKKQGFTRVISLSGGIGAWQQAGLPVEKQ